VEEEIRLAAAAELEPPPDHVPRSPIGPYRADLAGSEDTYVIGPNGTESTEMTEPDSNEPIPPTAADEQEGGGAPPPPTEELPHGAEPGTPPEPESPEQPEQPEQPDGADEPEEVNESDEPAPEPAETADASEPALSPSEEAPEPSDEGSDGSPQ